MPGDLDAVCAVTLVGNAIAMPESVPCIGVLSECTTASRSDSSVSHADLETCAAGFYASEETAPSKEEAKGVLLRARELGIGFYNTAILYGPETNEQLIGAVTPSRLRETPCRLHAKHGSESALNLDSGLALHVTPLHHRFGISMIICIPGGPGPF